MRANSSPRRCAFFSALTLLSLNACAGPAYERTAARPFPAAGYQSHDAVDESARALSVAQSPGFLDPASRTLSSDSSEREVSGPPLPNAPANPKENKIIIQATMEMSVDELETALSEVRKIAAEFKSIILHDDVRYDAVRARFILRIPPGGVDDVFSRLQAIGDVRQRHVWSEDVTKQFVDQSIQLDNLQRTLARYQEILKDAKNVEDILKVEAQLQNTRRQIESIKGQLRYLNDRVAMATLTLDLVGKNTATTFAPQAKVHPGLRLSLVNIARKGEHPVRYWGPSFSLHFARWMHVDVGAFSREDRGAFQADALEVFIGGETYSDFLGYGRRTWFNPYFGGGVGWLRHENAGRLSFGMTLGVEIYKSRYLLVDGSLRAFALIGKGGPQLAVQPGLNLNIAF